MLRDVDMSGCYNNILNTMNVYLGRPVVLEPGSDKMQLQEAVALMAKHANQDAWYIRVTGDLTEIANVLIPSTLGATTSNNYRRHRQRRHSSADATGAKLFSRRIESGIVTWPTWLIIQALPSAARRDYARLTVESVVFYP